MFELFERRREHIDLVPAMSVSAYGKMAFNKPASDFLVSKNWESVVLFFDRESKKIGIITPRTLSDVKYKLTYHGGNYFVFNSPAFVKFIKYPLKGTRQFPATWDEKEEMYVIDLSEAYRFCKTSL